MSGGQVDVRDFDDDAYSWFPDIIRSADALVIYDNDRTLWNRYAITLANQGFVFKFLDLASLRRGNRYNPFAYMKDDKDVTKLADAIMTGTEGLEKNGDNQFFLGEATLYSALIGIIHSEAPEYERNMNTLAHRGVEVYGAGGI